jgi:DegV family protein with EDD domain
MRITVGGVVHRDGDLPLEELIARYDEGVTTAAPAPGDFARLFAALPGEVLVLTVTESLSSTIASARLAAADAGPRVRVLDSGTAAGSLALVALHAATVARGGGTFGEVEQAARRVMARVRLVAALGTLDYLVRGGRLPGVVGGLASRLGVRPLVQVRDGHLRKLRPAFSKRAADERMVEMLLRSRVGGARLHVVGLHVLAEQEARSLLARVRAEVTPATELVSRFGASMVAHTGPDLTGLSWWWE